MVKWSRSDSPPPMEYWRDKKCSGGTERVYIRKFGRTWKIVRYSGAAACGSDGYTVEAGPFKGLTAAKTAWLLLFPA